MLIITGNKINNSSNSTYCFLNFIQFGLTGEGGGGYYLDKDNNKYL